MGTIGNPKLDFFRGHNVELIWLINMSTSVMCLKRTAVQPVAIINNGD